MFVDEPVPAEYVETDSARLLSRRALLDSDEAAFASVELKADAVVAAVVPAEVEPLQA